MSDNISISITSNKSQKTITQNENIEKLKENLGKERDEYKYKIISELEKENNYFKDLTRPDNILNINYYKEDSKFNDEIFEEKMVSTFQDNFKLDSLDMFPFFEVVYSKKKPKKVTQISYYQILCFPNIKKKDDFSKFCFLYNRDNFAFQFRDLTMAFNRDDGKPSLCVMIKGSDGYKNYKLNKSEKYYDVTIQYKDLVEELLKINNDIETLRSDINDEKNEDKSQTKKEKLKALEDIKVLIEKKYTEQQIENLKSMKENEIQILDKKIKLIEKYEKNEKNEGGKGEEKNDEILENLKRDKIDLENEKNKYEKWLSKVYVKIEKIEKELDGFFITRKEIVLTNSLGDTLKIQANSPIIVEVKNNKNYSKLLKNIQEKKKLIYSLGIDLKAFYFVGILRATTFKSQSEEKEAQTKIEKFNFERVIVLYPENLKFFGNSLITCNDNNSIEINNFNDMKSLILKLFDEIKEIKKEIQNKVDKKEEAK